VQRRVQQNLDIWLLDGTRATRLTFDPANDFSPVWSPDGAQVAFDSGRTGVRDLYLKPSNGTGPEMPLVTSAKAKVATDWSRDGRFIAYEEFPGDLWIVPLAGDRRPFLFLRTDFLELEAHFSPDVKWVAYKSNESGQYEVYVRPFSDTSTPARGGQWQVSSAGGINPRWRSDGRELYYLAPDSTLMAVPIEVRGTTLAPGAPVALFRPKIVGGGAGFSTEYDVSRDGRFLINMIVEDSAPPITIIQNWKPQTK
jgi:Tol biopolymer transport system component